MALKSKEMKALWDKLERTKDGINKTIMGVVASNTSVIAKMNAAQMYAGRDSKGQPIVPAYSEATKRIKRQKRQPINRVTLRDTGNFHFNNIVVTAMYNRIDIDTSITGARPYDFLMKKYGEDILGLDQTNIKIFFEQKLRKSYFRTFNGAPFDPEYRWNNHDHVGRELYYCSEMITKLLNPFLKDKIPVRPMDFSGNWDFWHHYFLGDVPQGELGNSPEDIAKLEGFYQVRTLTNFL